MFSIIRRQDSDIVKIPEKWGVISNARVYAERMGYGKEGIDYIIVNEKTIDSIVDATDFDKFASVGQKDG